MRRFSSTLVAAAIAMAAAASAQTRVHTEIVRPPAAPNVDNRANNVVVTGAVPAPPEVITDLARLPPAVAATRARILAAARTGRLDALVGVMQSSETMPVFSIHGDKDPTTYWRENYPDSQGLEVLAIVIEVLETGFVHVDQGTPDEMYVWPYFARVPLKTLTPAQKVELFKFITGSDYKEMLNAGAYNFFRIGIGQDGSWRFVMTGD